MAATGERRKLTPRQQRFVQEYLKDLNATAASRRAGYKNADKGRQLVAKSHVQAAIQRAMEKREVRTEIAQDWILQRLKEEADFTGEGSSHAARIKALELLGKHLGMFVDRLEIHERRELYIVESIVTATAPAADAERLAAPAPEVLPGEVPG